MSDSQPIPAQKSPYKVELEDGTRLVARAEGIDDYLAATDATADLMHGHEEVVRGIVRRAVEAGQLRPVHPVVASATFFGAMNTIARTFDPVGDLTLGEMTDASLDLLLEGWRA